MASNNLFSLILEQTEGGKDAVLVTVTAHAGSIPRSAGARMLVGKSGRLYGTIGGGKVEHQSIALAQELLDQKTSQSKAFILRPNELEDLGMICGGDVETYFQFIRGNDEAVISLMRECLAGFAKGEALWLFTDFTDETAWSMSLYRPGEASQTFSPGELQGLTKPYPFLSHEGGRRIYSEPIHFAEKVVIFGGGHVAQALSRVLSPLGFRCAVFEDRKDFLTQDLFPAAFDLVLGDFNRIGDALTLSPYDYAVVLTRGHVFDAIAEKYAIEQNCSYIGVIGSKTKVAAVRQRLLAQGISPESLDRVYSPIGLAIDAETPEEIAISIAAEMIRHRARTRKQA